MTRNPNSGAIWLGKKCAPQRRFTKHSAFSSGYGIIDIHTCIFARHHFFQLRNWQCQNNLASQIWVGEKRVGLLNAQLTSVVSLVGWYSNRMSLSSLFGFLMRRTTLSGRDAIGAAAGAGAAGKKTSLHGWNLERPHDKS